MAVTHFDRAFCTTTSTGVGALALTAQPGFIAPFTSDEVPYCVYDDAGNWEIGAAPTLSGLQRDVIPAPFASSNAGAFVNFGAGTKKVVFSIAAGELVFCGRDSARTTWATPKAFDGGIVGGNGAVAYLGVALGEQAYCSNGGIAIGKMTYTVDGINIGEGALCDNGVAIGKFADASYATQAVAIGRNVICGTSSGVLTDAVAVGTGAKVYAEDGVAIGVGAEISSTATGSVALGKGFTYLPNTIVYAHKPWPSVSGDIQASASSYTQTAHTNVSSNTFVDLDTQENCLFNIDVVGIPSDGSAQIVGVNIVGLRGPNAIVGTPVTTVRGRSGGLAGTVTASVSMVGQALRVSMVGSASYALDWAIVARFSAVANLP